jgi:response regulator RpfG family c-di-GMP phosphodiesterase
VKVLVVDDIAYSRRALRSVFFSAGWAVLQAEDGQQALDVVQAERPDLVVTDILMPRMDGFQLCRTIKSDPTLWRIPVVFYTGSYGEAADRDFGLSLGAAAYLLKPMEPRELIGAVTRAIGKPTPELKAKAEGVDPDWTARYADRLHAKLQEKVRELHDTLERLEATYTGTVEAFYLVLARREGADPIEAERPARLAQLFCEQVAPEVAADPNTLRGFLLHDIGKLLLPDALLHKSTPLSAEEWAEFRRQPALAADVLRTVPGLEKAVAIVRHTRERWDGSGYPDALAGEAIPIAARVFAIADTFEAIVTGRPYRPRRPVPEAIAELRGRAGTQFDPGLVEPFIALVERLGR